MLRALKFIIECDLSDEILSKKYLPQDKEIAQLLYDGILNFPNKNEFYFRIHSKALGIFCKKKEGFKSNQLVVEYFGEIYRQWYWFEKQDVIK